MFLLFAHTIFWLIWQIDQNEEKVCSVVVVRKNMFSPPKIPDQGFKDQLSSSWCFLVQNLFHLVFNLQDNPSTKLNAMAIFNCFLELIFNINRSASSILCKEKCLHPVGCGKILNNSHKIWKKREAFRIYLKQIYTMLNIYSMYATCTSKRFNKVILGIYDVCFRFTWTWCFNTIEIINILPSEWSSDKNFWV